MTGTEIRCNTPPTNHPPLFQKKKIFWFKCDMEHIGSVTDLLSK